MNDAAQENRSSLQQASETRRRLLRGSLALPAVLTVCPGMASAASVVNCIQNPPPAGQKEAITAATTDVIPWVRVLIIANIPKSDDGFRYFQYPDNSWPPINWQSDTWYRINASTGDVARTGIPVQTQFYTSGTPATANQVSYKVVQLFTPTGQNAGLPQQVSPLQELNGWASINCLASITP